MTTEKQSLANISGIVKSRKIDNNTYEYTTDKGVRVIRLHNTDIVKLYPNGDRILNSGGWHSLTTKDRINAHLPARYILFQKNFYWYVSDNEGGGTINFYDGMILPQAFIDAKNKGEI